jgi:hypothetical protein
MWPKKYIYTNRVCQKAEQLYGQGVLNNSKFKALCKLPQHDPLLGLGMSCYEAGHLTANRICWTQLNIQTICSYLLHLQSEDKPQTENGRRRAAWNLHANNTWTYASVR